MSVNRYDAKRDNNEPAIIDVLERMCVDYWRLSSPADLLLFVGGRFYILEVKDPSQRWRFTGIEEDFFKRTRGAARWVVEFPREVEAIVNGLRRGKSYAEIGLRDPVVTAAGYKKAL